jgi:GNAT superfamily N-acetyltransferase
MSLVPGATARVNGTFNVRLPPGVSRKFGVTALVVGDSPRIKCAMDARADPLIVKTWVDGWALSRGTPAPEVLPIGFLVKVGLPQQRARYVLPEFYPNTFAELTSSIKTPWTFIKICVDPRLVTNVLPKEWTVQAPRYMMTAMLTDAASHYTGEFLRSVSCERSVIKAEFRGDNGEVVASGRAAVVGSSCVFDQIHTDEHYRRRGLGRATMDTLCEAAAEQGCSRGVLVATGDGHALYSAIGWSVHSLVTSTVILA